MWWAETPKRTGLLARALESPIGEHRAETYWATTGAGLPGSPRAAKSASVLSVEARANWFLRVRPALLRRRRRLPLVFFDSEAIERGVIAEGSGPVKTFSAR